MKPGELKDYAKKLYLDAGYTEEQAEAIISPMVADEKASEVLLKGFVPHPEYSSTLDKQKSQYEKQIDAAKGDIKKLSEWAEKVAVPQNRQLQSQLDQMKREIAGYRRLYGDLDDSDIDSNHNPAPNGNNNGRNMTPDQLEELLAARDREYVDLSFGVAEAAVDYMQTFGDRLNMREFREYAENLAAKGRQEGKRVTVWDAYEDYTREKREELQKTQLQKQLEEAEKRGYQKAEEEFKQKSSQRGLPTDSAHRDASFGLDILNAKKDDDPSTRRADVIAAWMDPKLELGSEELAEE